VDHSGNWFDRRVSRSLPHGWIRQVQHEGSGLRMSFGGHCLGRDHWASALVAFYLFRVIVRRDDNLLETERHGREMVQLAHDRVHVCDGVLAGGVDPSPF